MPEEEAEVESGVSSRFQLLIQRDRIDRSYVPLPSRTSGDACYDIAGAVRPAVERYGGPIILVIENIAVSILIREVDATILVPSLLGATRAIARICIHTCNPVTAAINIHRMSKCYPCQRDAQDDCGQRRQKGPETQLHSFSFSLSLEIRNAQKSNPWF